MRPCALIVEDEIHIALELEDTLSALGFYVCGVASTQDRARALAMSDHPELVLMDVRLEGGKEGIEAGRWVREVCQSEVVFVTAYADADTLQRIERQVPGAPVVAKPVSHAVLAEAVASLATGH
jgi:two-component system, response regulator PdtaR